MHSVFILVPEHIPGVEDDQDDLGGPAFQLILQNREVQWIKNEAFANGVVGARRYCSNNDHGADQPGA